MLVGAARISTNKRRGIGLRSSARARKYRHLALGGPAPENRRAAAKLGGFADIKARLASPVRTTSCHGIRNAVW